MRANDINGSMVSMKSKYFCILRPLERCLVKLDIALGHNFREKSTENHSSQHCIVRNDNNNNDDDNVNVLIIAHKFLCCCLYSGWKHILTVCIFGRWMCIKQSMITEHTNCSPRYSRECLGIEAANVCRSCKCIHTKICLMHSCRSGRPNKQHVEPNRWNLWK